MNKVSTQYFYQTLHVSYCNIPHLAQEKQTHPLKNKIQMAKLLLCSYCDYSRLSKNLRVLYYHYQKKLIQMKFHKHIGHSNCLLLEENICWVFHYLLSID